MPKSITPTKCPMCDFSAKKITAVDAHIREEHNMTPKDAYDNVFGKTYCECGCGSETLFNNIKHGYSKLLKGHNANIYALYSPEKAKEISDKRRSKLIGIPSWSKGLTKETDVRVAERAKKTSIGRRAAFAEEKITIWSKGLTKETDERVAGAAEALKEKYKNGEVVPWAKGLSKETDERIKAMALKDSITHMKSGIRARLDAKKRLDFDTIKQRIEDNNTLEVINIGDYKSDAMATIEVICTRCNTKFFSSLRRLKYGRCWTCNPQGSKAQGDIATFIEGLGVEVKKNCRDVISGEHRMAELDIYVPSHKLAVEYNGLYWHSELHKSNSYHDNKTIQCKESGIKLIQVFQDEWQYKQEIIKSMIKNRLNLSDRTVYARKCEVVTLTPKEKKAFFNANHIDGDTMCNHTIGLKFEGEIVGALSTRKPFHRKHSDALEVARLATLVNTNVVGGVTKMLKHAKESVRQRGFKRLMSYVDTRMGNGDWSNMGFTSSRETSPRFWWTDFDIRYNRFRFKADKARNMTEAQVAEEAGVVRIWGCKNLVLEVDV